MGDPAGGPRRARPRCVALEARGCECSEQAGSGLDAVAGVDAPAVAHVLRHGELEFLVDAELGADVIEAFEELLVLGTSQNPAVGYAALWVPIIGARAQGCGSLEGPVGPVLVVEVLEFPQRMQDVALVPDEGAV